MSIPAAAAAVFSVEQLLCRVAGEIDYYNWTASDNGVNVEFGDRDEDYSTGERKGGRAGQHATDVACGSWQSGVFSHLTGQ